MQKEEKKLFSPFAKVKDIYLGDVKWTKGFWQERFEVCHRTMVLNMWDILKNSEICPAFDNFLIAAGLKSGKHKGHPFFDGDLYKWLEATAALYAVTRDEKLDRLMDEVIDVIAKAQRKDGYLHTPVIIAQNLGKNEPKELQNKMAFEMYNFGHLMSAACMHYRATSKESLLLVAENLSVWLSSVFRKPTRELAENAICPSHYMGLADLYRLTGDKKHLELLKTMIGMRDLIEAGTDQNQDRIPFRDQRKAVGHAVRANYLYAGAADLYVETGEDYLLKALESIWENVTYQKMYITGATGALYDGASPDGWTNQREAQLIHQAYGREYQLPNTTAYNETCANIGNAFWNWRMFKITAQARFMDVVELVLYNSLLSGISLDGKRYCYINELRHESELPFKLRWYGGREPYLSCFCCPPNIVRTIAEAGQYAYGVAENQIWVNMYGSSELESNLPDGSSIALKQDTDYPWAGKTKIVTDFPGDREVSLMLRIPGWTTAASIKLNGKVERRDLKPESYFEMKRLWTKGDAVEVDLEMDAQLIEAHPLVEELRNQVAVKRGPIIYCLESVDLPHDVKISEIVIPHGIKFTPKKGQNGLKGITLLTGDAELQRAGDWSKKLYRPLSPRESGKIHIQFIPYFSWDNRDTSEMTVWFPVR